MPMINGSNVTMESPDPCSKYYNHEKKIDQQYSVGTNVFACFASPLHGLAPRPAVGYDHFGPKQNNPFVSPAEKKPSMWKSASKRNCMPLINGSNVTLESPDPCSKYYEGKPIIPNNSFEMITPSKNEIDITIASPDPYSAFYQRNDTYAECKSPDVNRFQYNDDIESLNEDLNNHRSIKTIEVSPPQVAKVNTFVRQRSKQYLETDKILFKTVEIDSKKTIDEQISPCGIADMCFSPTSEDIKNVKENTIFIMCNKENIINYSVPHKPPMNIQKPLIPNAVARGRSRKFKDNNAVNVPVNNNRNKTSLKSKLKQIQIESVQYYDESVIEVEEEEEKKDDYCRQLSTVKTSYLISNNYNPKKKKTRRKKVYNSALMECIPEDDDTDHGIPVWLRTIIVTKEEINN